MDICSTKKQEKENEHESMFTGRRRKADGKLFFCADRRHRNPHLVSDRFDHQDPGRDLTVISRRNHIVW